MILNALNIGTLNKIKQTFISNIFTRKNTVDNKGLEKDSFTESIDKTEKKRTDKENYEDVVKTLTLFNINAQNAFDAQYKKGGLFAKSVDNISSLWFSKNRYKLVKEDLETYKNQVDELSKSIDKGTFTSKFEDVFGIKYDQKNIDKYNEANQRLMLASTTKYMADTINEKLEVDLRISKENKGKLAGYFDLKMTPYSSTGSNPVYYERYNKETVYNRMEKAITEVVGGKDVLNNMLISQNIKENSTKEEKYTAYSNIANFLTQTSNMTAKRCSDGKDLKDLTKDYNEAYENAFGTKNNIQKRVDNYNRSQQIGASMLKTGVKNPIKLALIGLAGLANPLAAIPTGVALSFGIDMLEKATNNDKKDGEFSPETIQRLMKDTALSYADYVIEAGVNAILPNFTTGNAIINTILSTARKTTLDVTTSMISEYMNSGKWDNSQIAPRAFVSAVFGKISPDDQLAKNLLSMTKNGVKKSLLYDESEKNSVRQFINKMQVELQKEYMKNPELYSSMKAISMANPEAFEAMIVDLLQEHVDNAAQDKEAKKSD